MAGVRRAHTTAAARRQRAGPSSSSADDTTHSTSLSGPIPAREDKCRGAGGGPGGHEERCHRTELRRPCRPRTSWSSRSSPCLPARHELALGELCGRRRPARSRSRRSASLATMPYLGQTPVRIHRLHAEDVRGVVGLPERRRHDGLGAPSWLGLDSCRFPKRQLRVRNTRADAGGKPLPRRTAENGHLQGHANCKAHYAARRRKFP